MICSPEFIKVYSDTFKFIDENLGYVAVENYWKRIAPIALEELDRCVFKAKWSEENINTQEGFNAVGLAAARDYWDRVLKAEGAVYSIDASIVGERTAFTSHKPFIRALTLNIYECPSLKILGDKAYENYCAHCIVMYQPIFDKNGYDYALERKEKGCKIRITRKKSVSSETGDTPEAAST